MTSERSGVWLTGFVGGIMLLVGCNGVPQELLDQLPDIPDVVDDIIEPDLVEFETYATNTGGASGLALDGDDNVYIVNSSGVFGPVAAGADISDLDPIGAENLIPDIFPEGTTQLVLAIANSGDFWIGSGCCSTLARVPAAGGDAEEFGGLLAGGTTGVQAETMALVPDGFDGPQINPGDLLVSRETISSSDRMSAIAVDGDLTVIDVDNPRVDPLNPEFDDLRHGHHLTFGLDGQLYASRGTPGLLLLGLQTIAPDGTPTALPNTLGVAAESFVALANGDLLLRGVRQTSGAVSEAGMFWYTAADAALRRALSLSLTETTESDEMVIASDGRIFLALPQRNEIVRVIDIR